LFTANEVKRVHLVGIGGTAMAALAAMLQERGLLVSGSDQAIYPPMSDFLAQRRIPVMEGFSPQNLGPDLDLAVVGNAISRGNPELEALLERRIPYRSFPEVLRAWFLEGKRSLVVAGTHGKTTTASLLSWILLEAGEDPGFLVGGIPRGLEAGCRVGEGELFVVEGDEYDTAFFDKRPKFLHYLPWVVTLGGIEYDHADIYHSMEQMLGAYRMLLRVVPGNGRLVLNMGDPHARLMAQDSPCPVVGCAVGQPAQWTADGIRVERARTIFRVLHHGLPVGECQWALPGRHNVINGLLALAAAREAGVDTELAIQAMCGFQGVRRRLEFLGEIGGVLLYDDFAHHPSAIRAGLSGLRELHPGARLWAIFEPRSNSMCRRVFQEELPRAFAQADRVILAGVHRAERIPPGDRLDPQEVVQAINGPTQEAWYIPRIQDIVAFVRDEAVPGDVLCVMSNGGFGGIQGLLMEALGARGPGSGGNPKPHQARRNQ
jgi:UDP-N-acetylmuramate: L-alanyl-gamma-D-glutamyl-meso-diaminopimelate ligase